MENTPLKNLLSDLKMKRVDLALYFIGIINDIRKESFLNRKEILENFAKKLHFKLNIDVISRYLNEDFTLNHEGFDRIKNILPKYLAQRKWDGYFYLIIFDIPEKLKVNREMFRRFLKNNNFALLQGSVWLSPFIFIEEIDKIKNKLELMEENIISFRAEGISIKDPKIFANKLWNIEKINLEYLNFINTFSHPKDIEHLLMGQFSYLSILKRDPQLPIEFLLDNWQGKIANDLYQKLINSFFIELMHK